MPDDFEDEARVATILNAQSVAEVTPEKIAYALGNNTALVAVDDAFSATDLGEFLVNQETNSSQSGPSITALNGGGFVVTWHSKDGVEDTDGWGIKARIFDANGAEVVSEFLGSGCIDFRCAA